MSFSNFIEAEFGKYPIDWSISKLGEVITTLTDYHANGAYKKLKENVELLDEENYAIMIRTTNFEQNAFNKQDFKYITENAYDFLQKTKVYKNDILMNKIANAGSVYIVPTFNKPVSLAMNLFLIRVNQEVINQKYAYYFMKNYERYIKTRAEGSVTKTITKENVRRLEIVYPSIQEQEKIVKLIYSLEKKIEINNQINKKLEEMAQAIFKHWFVDFEFGNEEGLPYKSYGGEMIDSELGMIPMGWEVGVFRDYTNTVLGGDWGKETVQNNYIKEVYCLRGADITEVRCGRKGALPKRYILEKNFENKKLSSGDLVVEISGGSPTQSTGRITYISKNMIDKYDAEFVCTNFCRAITLKNKEVMEYFYYYWTRVYDLNVFFQFENGTTGIKNFDINTFLDKFLIIKPTTDLIEKFNTTIMILLNKIQVNGSENMKLVELRDTLLPKLMSGEIDLRNLEINI